jgi:hypothetical protein
MTKIGNILTLLDSSKPFSILGKNILTTAQKISLLKNFATAYRDFVCFCPKSDKITNKIGFTNPDIPTTTLLQRQVETIKYVPGGRTQYGNFTTNAELMAYLEEVRNSNAQNTTTQNNTNVFASMNNRLNFNGQFEGQPGGIKGPLKIRNRF